MDIIKGLVNYHFRYEFSKMRFEMLKVQRAMEEAILAEGTERDPRLGEKNELVEVIET